MADARRLASSLYLASRLQEELDRAIAAAGELAEGGDPASALAPAMDVLETGGAVVVLLEAPGLTAADLEIECAGNRLTVRGRRPEPEPPGGPVRFHCLECGRGDFQRVVELAGALDTHGARARLADGLLRIEIPRIEDRRRRPRLIEIESPEP